LNDENQQHTIIDLLSKDENTWKHMMKTIDLETENGTIVKKTEEEK
jgi:hypothetical protein